MMMMKRVLAVGATALIALAAAAPASAVGPELKLAPGKCLGDAIAESHVDQFGGVPVPGCAF